MSGGHNAPTDLTKDEQANVRAALRFLHKRFGGWVPVAKILHVKHTTLSHAVNGKTVSAAMAFRVARLAKVTVDDVVSGRFPEAGTCPMCGHRQRSNEAT